MVQGIRQYLLKQTAESVENRPSLWQRDRSSPEAYERSVAPNRERFRKVVGLIDARLANCAPVVETTVGGACRGCDGLRLQSAQRSVAGV